MAEIHAGHQPTLVMGSFTGQVCVNETLCGGADRLTTLRDPTVDQGKESPDRIGPTARRPTVVGSQRHDELVAPTSVGERFAFGTPLILGPAREVSHRL